MSTFSNSWIQVLSKIKNWLKKSGTYDFHDQEIIDELPFDKFFKHPSYPYFWLYEDSFFNRLKDAYEVLVGRHYNHWEHPTKKGLLDVLIFPGISRKFILNPYFNRAPWPLLFFLYLGLPIALILEDARFTLGALITFLVSPIIVIVHACAYSKTQSYLKEISQLQLIPYPDPNRKDWVACELGNMSSFRVKYDPNYGFLLMDEKLNEPLYIISLHSENAEGIDALLAINRFNVLDEITPEHLLEVQTWLTNLIGIKNEAENALQPHMDKMPMKIILTYADLLNRKDAGEVKASFAPNPTTDAPIPPLKEDKEQALEEISVRTLNF